MRPCIQNRPAIQNKLSSKVIGTFYGTFRQIWPQPLISRLLSVLMKTTAVAARCSRDPALSRGRDFMPAVSIGGIAEFLSSAAKLRTG